MRGTSQRAHTLKPSAWFQRPMGCPEWGRSSPERGEPDGRGVHSLRTHLRSAEPYCTALPMPNSPRVSASNLFRSASACQPIRDRSMQNSMSAVLDHDGDNAGLLMHTIFGRDFLGSLTKHESHTFDFQASPLLPVQVTANVCTVPACRSHRGACQEHCSCQRGCQPPLHALRPTLGSASMCLLWGGSRSDHPART